MESSICRFCANGNRPPDQTFLPFAGTTEPSLPALAFPYALCYDCFGNSIMIFRAGCKSPPAVIREILRKQMQETGKSASESTNR